MRRLIALPVDTPSLCLLVDKAAQVLAGKANALNDRALLVADPARPVPATRKLLGLHLAEPISIFGTVFDEIDFSLWTANLRTRRFRQYFAAAASNTVREIAMHEMLGEEEARVKAKVLLKGQKGKTRICRATGPCVEPRANCPRPNIPQATEPWSG